MRVYLDPNILVSAFSTRGLSAVPLKTIVSVEHPEPTVGQRVAEGTAFILIMTTALALITWIIIYSATD